MANTAAIKRAKEAQKEISAINKRMREIMRRVKSGKATDTERLELTNLNALSEAALHKVLNSLSELTSKEL